MGDKTLQGPFELLLQTAEKELGVQLRAHQIEGLRAVYDRADVIVSVETGAGKTMIALAAPYLRGWTRLAAPEVLPLVLTIVPLRSVAVSHTSACVRAGFSALNASSDTLDSSEHERVLKTQLRAYTHVFVSAERVMSADWLACLSVPEVRQRVVAVVVDEAHVVPKWAPSFRRSFGSLYRLRVRLPGVPVVALTATDPPEVRADMTAMLGLKEPRMVTLPFVRANLYYRVLVEQVEGGGRRPPPDPQPIVDLATQLLEQRERTPRTLIFARTLQDVTTLFMSLRLLVEHSDETAMDKHVAFFIGPSDERVRLAILESLQQADGAIRIVIATSAMGLGVDVRNVTQVIHYGAPDSLDDYIQQAGRAGRDAGSTATVTLLAFSTHKASLDSQMLAYIQEPDGMCRRQHIQRYLQPDNHQPTCATPCCDLCDDPTSLARLTDPDPASSEDDADNDDIIHASDDDGDAL